MQIKIRYLFFMLIIFPVCISLFSRNKNASSNVHISLILDPSGDARHTGRSIDDSFERGLTLQCAENIKLALQEKNYGLSIITTRAAGDVVHDLQNANLSNKVNPDLFITLNFYFTQAVNPTLTLYQYANQAHLYHSSIEHDNCIAYDHAYIINKEKTDNIIQHITHQLKQKQLSSSFSFLGSYALPVKQLVGIVAPSIIIEIGVNSKQSYDHSMPSLYDLIALIADYLENHHDQQ